MPISEIRREQCRRAMQKRRLLEGVREKEIAYNRLYRARLGESGRVRARVYDARRRLKPERQKQQREWRRRAMAENPSFSIGCRMRIRMANALRRQTYGTRKAGTLHQLIGCSWQKFWSHIESQFSEGMNWGNRALWHIDHIKPCCSFDLTKPEEQLACFNYTNLQPLWAKDNLKKNGRL